MITRTMCGWCHDMVRTELTSCPNCGHDAHVSRLECRCPRCTDYNPYQLTEGDVDEVMRELKKKRRRQ